MYTRMTNISLNDSILNTLLTNRAKLNEMQEQISTGKKIDTPSDDSQAAMDILSAKLSLNKTDTYISNVERAIDEVDTTSDILQSAVDYIHRVKELTVQAANATAGPDELAAIKSEIDQITEGLKDIGNTQFGNKYIFGGLATGTAPFQTTGANNDEINYAGTPSGDHERKVEIQEGHTVSINLPGDDIFGYYKTDPDNPPAMIGQGLFQTLSTLSQELGADPADKNAIRSKLDDLETDLSTILTSQAKLGGVYSRLEMTQNKLEDNKLLFEKQRSRHEDIDLVEAISQMQMQETTLQASLQVSSRVLQPTLLNYL